jgi:signal transduction histidine kinase/DNA-binding LacI/PurR family transcriptional regulator
MRIALYLNILVEEYQIAVYRGIRSGAKELGIELVCVQDESGPGVTARRIESFPLPRYLPVDGVLILTSVIVGGDERLFAKSIRERFPGLPVVAVGNDIPGIPSIRIRGAEAMRGLMAHLVKEHGYRRFLYIGGHRDHRDNRERETAFRESTEGAGLEGTVVNSNFTEEGAARIVRAEIARAIRDGRAPPDAIVAASDNMAIGALKAIREAPDPEWQACAVTGFDDIPQAALEVPALTTVRQPFARAGKIAVETISALVRGKDVEEQSTIESTPVIRSSCGCGDFSPRRKTSRDAITHKRRASLEESLAAPRDQISRLQRQRARSEQLLRTVSIFGQRLATVAEVGEIPRFLEDFLAEIGARAFYLALFPSGSLTVPDRCFPAFSYDNGERTRAHEGEEESLADFLSTALESGTEATRSRSVYQLVAGTEIVGVAAYEVEDDALPHVYASAVFVANAVKRLRALDSEKEHSRELEIEVAIRTKDLSETNRKLEEEAERRREVEAEVLRIGELERQRFSLDLHDDICQRLAGISMFCKSLEPMVAQGDPMSVREAANGIAELSVMIDETLSRTRQYAHDSFPVELDALGLRDALGALCRTTERQTGCACDFSWNAPPESPLDRARDINVYRIAQEALANAVRHSRATEVAVAVEIETAEGGDRFLFVRIRDNGKGNPELEKEQSALDGGRDARRGLGLRSMRYRARQIGATYRIASSFAGGTLVELGIALGNGNIGA